MSDLKRPSAVPSYSVRVSPRAKRMQLRVTPLGDVEVVVPRRFDHRLIPVFVRANQTWLESKLAQAERRLSKFPHLQETVPQRIRLLAIDEEWTVRQCAPAAPTAGKRYSRCHSEGRFVDVHADGEALYAALRLWLMAKARTHIEPWLRRISSEVGLPYNHVVIRSQKTRWGSCSATKNISINRNVLFLPAPLVRYLFVHELAHTVHLDHSRRYWMLVERIEPDYRNLDAALKQASLYIPRWAQLR